MVKNIIFDLGRVLLSFEPRKYVEGLFGKGEVSEEILRLIFGSAIWLELDRGSLSDEEAFAQMSVNAKHLQEMKTVFENWVEILMPINPTIEILKALKAQNYPLYLLSNFHHSAYEWVTRQYDFFTCFHGTLISADVKLIKPDRAIYQKLLKMYGLNPEECVFIDDTPENITAAKELGINGIIFDNAEQLRQELTVMGVSI